MKKKITITAMSLLTALFLLPINGFAYTINNEFNLGANEGSSQVANNQYILLHETANETATGRNEAPGICNVHGLVLTLLTLWETAELFTKLDNLVMCSMALVHMLMQIVLCKSSYNTHMIKKLLKRTIKYTLNWQEIQQ